MLNVSTQTKNAFLNGGSKKTFRITFYEVIENGNGPKSNYVIGNDKIIAKSLKIKQSIQSGNKIDFIGCIASTASFEIARSTYALKDKKIKIEVTAEGADAYITLFTGVVESAKKDSDSSLTEKISCIDKMNELLDDKDVTDWYDSLGDFNMTLRAFRNSLFSYLGIEQNETTLIRDSMMLTKTLDTRKKEDEEGNEVRQTVISAATVIQCICQINGVFGQISNDGRFKYVRVNTNGTYTDLDDGYIIKTSHEDTKTNLITGVVLYDSSSEEYDDTGEALAYYPEDKEKIKGDDAVPFEIKDNFLLYALPNQSIAIDIARDLYNVINTVTFTPCTIEMFGLPWLECGDHIAFTAPGLDTLLPSGDLNPSGELYPSGGELVKTVIMTRTFSGTSMFTDSIEVKGDDLNSSITSISEVISAERFYRKIGDEKTYSAIEQTNKEIKSIIYDEDTGVYSKIDQQANRIDLVVERTSEDMSAITTRLALTESEIALHAKLISAEAETLKMVVRETANIDARIIEIVGNDYVSIANAAGGTTIISGDCITTGTINCNRIGLSTMTIKGKTYSVDWNEILVPRCYANRGVTFTDMSKVLYASCWKEISIPILEEEKIGELTSIKIKGYNIYKILDQDKLVNRPICGPTTEYGVGTDEPNGWLMPKIIENNCDVYPTLTADIDHGKIY